MNDLNCAGSGTYAQPEPRTGVFACGECARRWATGSLIGGKIPIHAPLARAARVTRSSDPEALDLEPIETAEPRPRGSRRDG